MMMQGIKLRKKNLLFFLKEIFRKLNVVGSEKNPNLELKKMVEIFGFK